MFTCIETHEKGESARFEVIFCTFVYCEQIDMTLYRIVCMAGRILKAA